MKPSPLRAAAALTAALTTALSPLLVSAQTYEYKLLKPGLAVSEAATASPALQLSTSAINFGDVATNTTETRQVRVSNTGTGALSFTAAPTVTGAAAFSAGLTTCGATLAAATDCLAEATFSPTSTGTFNGVLTVTSALASSPHEVALVGTAFNPVSLASTTLPKAMMGKAYSYDFKQLLNVSNEVSPDKSLATWTGSGTLPTGLSFDTGTGVLSGTPSAVNEGASYTVTGTYKNNQGQQVYTVKVGEAVLEVTQIAAGDYHTCAVTTSGAAKCWGYNNYGQLGDGTTTARTAPVQVQGLTSGVTAVATSPSHTCAVTTSGAVKCWGSNGYGQLGDGTTTPRFAPVQVQGLASGVTAVAAGYYHTCAVALGGAVVCWGSNGYGQLGDGTTTQRNAPVVVQGLDSGVQSVASYYLQTCAVTSGGALKCWGYNGYGQLGDGTATNRATPVQVQGLTSGVTAVAAGFGHTCAIITESALKCWGGNSDGQLGDGTTAGRATPGVVQGLASGVQYVVAGRYHTCAVASGGALKCWGRNDEGELGDGTKTQRKAPVNVLPGT